MLILFKIVLAHVSTIIFSTSSAYASAPYKTNKAYHFYQCSQPGKFHVKKSIADDFAATLSQVIKIYNKQSSAKVKMRPIKSDLCFVKVARSGILKSTFFVDFYISMMHFHCGGAKMRCPHNLQGYMANISFHGGVAKQFMATTRKSENAVLFCFKNKKFPPGGCKN